MIFWGLITKLDNLFLYTRKFHNLSSKKIEKKSNFIETCINQDVNYTIFTFIFISSILEHLTLKIT